MANDMEYNKDLTLDEIVFEHRNKKYGAYDLRQKYPKLLTRAFIIGTVSFLVAAITPFVVMKIKQMTQKDKVELDMKMINIQEDEPILEQPNEEEPTPPPPPKEEPKVEIIKDIVPEPVKAPKIETPPPTMTEKKETTTGTINQEGEKKTTYEPPKIENPGKPAAVESKPQINLNEVYTTVDQAAEYPGGMKSLVKFLYDNFDQDAVDFDGETLKTEVEFVVERDGTVSGAKVIKKSKDKDFDKEAVRIVSKLKKWTPAKKDGQAVRSFYRVPFSMGAE